MKSIYQMKEREFTVNTDKAALAGATSSFEVSYKRYLCTQRERIVYGLLFQDLILRKKGAKYDFSYERRFCRQAE